ncbi:MAG: division/cell wall cluster transcriptional repressor MraZ [Spartobacteria bacterium]|nr:division/cell wall cluster transcriptional repressor MraZ [Spartobacteria bacterium]
MLYVFSCILWHKWSRYNYLYGSKKQSSKSSLPLTQCGAKWFKVGHKECVMERHETTTKIDNGMELDPFFGTYRHAMDGKKRLTIPSDWRAKLGEPHLFVLPGVNVKCLTVFPAREMARRLEKFRNVSIADAKAQQFARAFFARANQVPWDSNGRIRVSDDLLNWAGLDKQVVLAGVGTRFELWAPEVWDASQLPMDSAGFEEAAQYIGF